MILLFFYIYLTTIFNHDKKILNQICYRVRDILSWKDLLRMYKCGQGNLLNGLNPLLDLGKYLVLYFHVVPIVDLIGPVNMKWLFLFDMFL